MDGDEKQLILEKAKIWFRETVVANHIANTLKLKKLSQFNVNPFLKKYLANYLTGNSSPESIARALIYPRVLGQSITTSFGQNMQSFASDVLSGWGSTTAGIDIEFNDCSDGQKKYCQLKAGPNTINKDDVESIAGHFKAVLNLSRVNNLRIPNDDLIVGVIYGTQSELSGHYRRLESQYRYPVYAGADFWTRLTGDAQFYVDLADAIGSVAEEADCREQLDEVVSALAEQLN